MSTVAPVACRARPDARNAIVLATSSGGVTSPSGSAAIAPSVNGASSEARNATSAATSSGRPMRPKGHLLVEVGHRQSFAGETGFEHGRVNLARAHGVYAHIVGSVVAGEILREGHDGCLGHVVGVPGRRVQAPLRSGVDDRAATGGDHVGKTARHRWNIASTLTAK